MEKAASQTCFPPEHQVFFSKLLMVWIINIQKNSGHSKCPNALMSYINRLSPKSERAPGSWATFFLTRPPGDAAFSERPGGGALSFLRLTDGEVPNCVGSPVSRLICGGNP